MSARGGSERTRRRDCRRVRRAVAHVAVLVGAGTLLASCLPVAPPPPPVSQYCAPSTPASAAGYQSAFDNLQRTYTEWETADGAFPVTLPDGRVVWLFGDTWTGRVNPDGSIPNSGFVHNSFVVQSGPCFQPMLGGAVRARSSLIPDPAPGEWYWPTAAAVDGGVLRVFVWHMQQAPPNGAPGLAFNTIDMEVASYTLPNLVALGVQHLPFPTGTTPGTAPYGATAVSAPDGFVYLYGSLHGNAYAARTPIGQVAAGPWQFFTGTGWSPDPTQAAPMTWINTPPHLPAFGAGAGPVAQPWVVPFQSGYLATAEPLDGFSNQVWGFTAPTPAGPWTYQNVIAPAPSDIPSYGESTPLSLPGTTMPVVIYSVNSNVFASGPVTIDLYGPRFTAPTTLP